MNINKLICSAILSVYMTTRIHATNFNANAKRLSQKIFNINNQQVKRTHQKSFSVKNQKYTVIFENKGNLNKIDKEDILKIIIQNSKYYDGDQYIKREIYIDKGINGIGSEIEDHYSYRKIFDGELITKRTLNKLNKNYVNKSYNYIINKILNN
jgi:hypothetical protein